MLSWILLIDWLAMVVKIVSRRMLVVALERLTAVGRRRTRVLHTVRCTLWHAAVDLRGRGGLLLRRIPLAALMRSSRGIHDERFTRVLNSSEMVCLIERLGQFTNFRCTVEFEC